MRGAAAAGIAAVASVWIWALAPGASSVRVDCVNVGAGACWIVRGTEGRAVMINCGAEGSDSAGRSAVAAASSALARAGINRVDALVVTRAEPDAVSGVQELLRQVKPVHLLASPGAMLSGRLPSQGVRWERLSSGSVLRLSGGPMITVLGQGETEGFLLESAAGSVVLLDNLTHASVEQAAQFDPDVLVLGYRASRTGGVSLGRLTPRAAVLTSGRSRQTWADYGLSRSLRGAARRVYNTGVDGGVVIQLRRGDIRIVSAGPPAPDR